MKARDRSIRAVSCDPLVNLNSVELGKNDGASRNCLLDAGYAPEDVYACAEEEEGKA